jgi:hypothetical protein
VTVGGEVLGGTGFVCAARGALVRPPHADARRMEKRTPRTATLGVLFMVRMPIGA